MHTFYISYRTSVQASTGFTPFFLMHFREAKLPVHVQMERSGSSTYVTETSNLKDVKALIHLQEQCRAKAAQNILGAQARQKKQYDMKHNMNSTLKVGDKVFKENTRNKHRKGGKLENRWNGPFVIHKDLGKGRYYLETLAGKVLKQTIHCARLKLFLEPVGDKETISSVVDEEAVSAQGDDNASELRNCGANEKDDGNGTIIQDGSGDKENGVIDGDSEGIREQHEGSPTEKEMSEETQVMHEGNEQDSDSDDEVEIDQPTAHAGGSKIHVQVCTDVYCNVQVQMLTKSFFICRVEKQLHLHSPST